MPGNGDKLADKKSSVLWNTFLLSFFSNKEIRINLGLFQLHCFVFTN